MLQGNIGQNGKSAPAEIVVYASLGYPHAEKDCWRAQIQGRLFQDSPVPLGKRLMLKGLQRAMKVQKPATDSLIFQERVKGFLVSPEPGRRIRVEIAGRVFRVRRRSRRSGLFTGKIDIPKTIVESWRLKNQVAPDEPLPFQAHIVGEPQTAQGKLYLAPQFGLSVISDIDDTIKLTRVTSRRDMLAHTFALPFTTMDGMAEVYRNWASHNAMFHYVSSSPWQIYHHLADFIEAAGFPQGSMHLRWFRLRDEMFKRWQVIRRKSKGGLIADMIKRMPGRRFVLVGDSGERDPEIYAKLARRFDDRVTAVVIRDLVENPIDPRRLRKIQRRTGAIPLILFRHSSEILDLVGEMDRKV